MRCLAALLTSLSEAASLSAADAITMATVVGAQGADFLMSAYSAQVIPQILSSSTVRRLMATERRRKDIAYVAAGGCK